MLFGYWTTGFVGMCLLKETKQKKEKIPEIAFGLQAPSVLCFREGEKQNLAVFLR